jgi:hypothetical protein
LAVVVASPTPIVICFFIFIFSLLFQSLQENPPLMFPHQ